MQKTKLLGLICYLLWLALLGPAVAQLPDGFYPVYREANSPEDLRPLARNEAIVVHDPSILDGGESDKIYLVVKRSRFAPMELKEPVSKTRDQTLRTQFWLTVSLTDEAGRRLETLTSQHLNKTIAVVVGGQSVTKHKVREAIRGGKVQISRCGDNGCQVLFRELSDNVAQKKYLRISRVPIRFPDGYSGEESEIRATLQRAQAQVDRFADKHGWSDHKRPLFYDSVEIYRSKERLLKRILEMHSLPLDTKIEATVVGALEKRVLLAVGPRSLNKLPVSQGEPDAFRKLLAHEIGHRLHHAVVNGVDDDMGSRWFYEGFATVLADQWNEGPARPDNVGQCMASNNYKRYGALLRLCLQHWPLEELVQRARSSDFDQWVQKELSRAWMMP